MTLLLLFPMTAAALGVPLDSGQAPPAVRQVYYQARFEPLPLVQAFPIGWQQPLAATPAKTPRAVADFGSLPFFTPVAVSLGQWQAPLSTVPAIAKARAPEWQLPYSVATVVSVAQWQQPLSTAPVLKRVIDANQPLPFYPVTAAVVTVTLGWQPPLAAAPSVAKVQADFGSLPLYSAAPVVAAYVPTLEWQQPLGTVPHSVTYAPTQYSFESPWFVTVTPAETGTILMPGKAGGGGFSRKRWREIQEQEAAERRALLAEQKQIRDDAARIKLEAQTARAAKIAAKADAAADKQRLEAVVLASDTAKQFAEQSSREEAEFLAALLAEIANQEDEDEVIMLLVGM